MRKLFRSFHYAIRGFRSAVKTERNMRIHLVACAIVIGLMIVLPTRFWQDIILGLLMISVLTLELVNTAMERLFNIIEPEYHKEVRMAKDVTAASVFVAALGALVIGIAIFVDAWK